MCVGGRYVLRTVPKHRLIRNCMTGVDRLRLVADHPHGRKTENSGTFQAPHRGTSEIVAHACRNHAATSMSRGNGVPKLETLDVDPGDSERVEQFDLTEVIAVCTLQPRRPTEESEDTRLMTGPRARLRARHVEGDHRAQGSQPASDRVSALAIRPYALPRQSAGIPSGTLGCRRPPPLPVPTTPLLTQVGA